MTHAISGLSYIVMGMCLFFAYTHEIHMISPEIDAWMECREANETHCVLCLDDYSRTCAIYGLWGFMGIPIKGIDFL